MAALLLGVAGGLGFLAALSVYCALKLASETDRITRIIETDDE